VKKSLKINHEINEKTKIIGIVTTEKDYKLSWLINNTINLNLKKLNVEKKYQQNEIFEINDFSKDIYFYIDELTFIRYILIKNKREEHIIFNSLKDFDFIFIISGVFDDSYVYGFLKNLKKLESIVAAYIVNKLSKKNKKFIDFILNVF